MPDPAIIDKVRKALNLASRASTEGEAAAAAGQAQRLMTKYRITEAMLAEAEKAEEEVKAWRITLKPTYFRADLLLLALIAQTNSCHLGYNAPARVAEVHGAEDDLANVRQLWEVLYPTMVRLARRQYAPTAHWSEPQVSDTTWRRSYRVGFAQGVGMRLEQARRAAAAEVDQEQGTSNALVVLDDRAKKAEESLGDLKPGRPMAAPDPVAAGVGQRDGYRAAAARV